MVAVAPVVTVAERADPVAEPGISIPGPTELMFADTAFDFEIVDFPALVAGVEGDGVARAGAGRRSRRRT